MRLSHLERGTDIAQGILVRMFVFGVLLLASAPQILFADQADTDYNRAAGYYKLMRWDLAAEGFRGFVAAYPKHEKVASARLYGGLAEINLKEFAVARENLRSFVKMFPKHKNYDHALYRVAECSYLLDDLKAAEPELTAYLEQFPDDPLAERALPYLGDVQLRLGKSALAAGNFEKSLEKFPKGVLAEDSKFGLARSLEALKKYPEAIRIYESLAKEKGPRAAEAQLNLGARYFDDRDFVKSAAAYASLTTQFPESPLVPVAKLNEGFARYQAGEFQAAATLFDAAATSPKQTEEARYWQGLSHKSLGEFAEAILLFQKSLEAQPEQALAANLTYQWADCEQHLGHFKEAVPLFLKVAEKWPKSDLADSGLHFAAVAAFDGGDVKAAEQLVARFDKDFPLSGLRWHQEILRGRLELARKESKAAVLHFQKVLENSKSENALAWAHYYLGFAWQQEGNDREVIAATDTLAKSLEQNVLEPGLLSIFVLRGSSQLALAKLAKESAERQTFAQAATSSSTNYLTLAKAGELRHQALSIRARAGALLGLKDEVVADLQTLRENFPDSSDLEKAQQEVAEIAYAGSDWNWSAELFRLMSQNGTTEIVKGRGWSGLGWSLYQMKMFDEAATSFEEATALFAKLLADQPEDAFLQTETPTVAFMQGKSLQDAQKPEEAVAVFQQTLQKYAPAEPAFKSGLQAARLLGELNQLEAANAAYAELLKKFPQPASLDRIYDEWALLNYAAENFERADEIFRKLVTETPDSDLADNARLSLAESDLLAGRVDAARTQFTALAASPKSDQDVQEVALFHLIGIAHETRQWKQLGEIGRQSLQRFPEGKYQWYAELRTAEADLNLNQLMEALARFRRVADQKTAEFARQAQWFPQVWVLMAETQFRLKQHPAVSATVAEFREWDETSPFLYLAEEVQGRSLKAQAMFKEARAVFEQVTKSEAGRLTETAAKSQFMIAETFLLEKDYAAAEKAYLEVEILYAFPEWQSPALYQAAICEEQLGHWMDAVKSYESLLKQFPTSEFAAKAKERLPAARKMATAT